MSEYVYNSDHTLSSSGKLSFLVLPWLLLSSGHVALPAHSVSQQPLIGRVYRTAFDVIPLSLDTNRYSTSDTETPALQKIKRERASVSVTSSSIKNRTAAHLNKGFLTESI